MKYISTRESVSPKSFKEVVFSGLASGGGLFLPQKYPKLDPNASGSIQSLAEEVIRPFVSGLNPGPILEKTFSVFPENPWPLKRLTGDLYLLELFHGPTASFKDFGLQFLGNLFEVLAEKPLNIIGATSGDTGAAAVQALKNKKGIRLFMLHPKGRISELQRRQMTTVQAPNVFNIAVEGSFDDCQALLKEMLWGGGFTTVNSINWVRILAQSVYYWAASLAFQDRGGAWFIVPSGNFGNAFSGYVSKRTGAPIKGLTIATNKNDILARALKTGIYRPGEAFPTISPAMDIQVASNFERLFFEVSGRKKEEVKKAAAALKSQGSYKIPETALKRIRQFFNAGRAGEGQTRNAMRKAFEDFGEVFDPHTAVGFSVLDHLSEQSPGPKILVSTAHPAKFPESVPHEYLKYLPLPEGLSSLMETPERYDSCKVDPAELKKLIKEKSHGS